MSDALDIRWLRNVANTGRGSVMTEALHAAADEIERLTAERDELLEVLHQLIAVIGLTAIKYKSDLDILQEAVDEASAVIAKAEGRQRVGNPSRNNHDAA